MAKKLTTEEFISKAVLVHGDKYDYSKVEYLGSHYKIDIECKIHGIFKQRASDHINKCIGCPHCSKNIRDSTKSFIQKAKILHTYDYSKVDYINSYTNVIILCDIHGEFKQSPNNHINLKNGCPQCKKEKLNNIFKNKNIILDFRSVHGNIYNYDKVKYVNNKTKVEIICKQHGSFFQAPSRHFNNKQGCPQCKTSKGEQQLSKLLEENSINFVSQKKFDGCKSKRLLPFDFYLIDYNICIEYDGIQHFQPVEYFGGEKAFKYTQENDLIKNQYCKDKNIILHRIKYDDNLKEAFFAILDQQKKTAGNK